MTFIYRHMPQLITSGKLFLAQPPLYRIDIGKETFWALDEPHKQRLLKQHGNGRAKAEITRFKGLGEMMPKVLWETTLNPRTRRLLRVAIVGSHRDRSGHQRADGEGRVGAVQIHHGEGRGGGGARYLGAFFFLLAGPHPRSLALGGAAPPRFPPAPRAGRRRSPLQTNRLCQELDERAETLAFVNGVAHEARRADLSLR